MCGEVGDAAVAAAHGAGGVFAMYVFVRPIHSAHKCTLVYVYSILAEQHQQKVHKHAHSPARPMLLSA